MASTIAQRRALKEARRRKILAKQRGQEGSKARAEAVDRVRRWARAPIHSCLIQRGLFERGLGMVVLARKIGMGELATAVFLVDVFCLGIKDAMIHCIGRQEFAEFIDSVGLAAPLARVEPSYARKLLREVSGYAASLGFRPHRDFTEAETLFGEVDTGDCDTVFRFGRDGKPCYIPGPNQSQGEICKTVQQLRSRLGDGGFTYIVPADELEFADDDLWDEILADEELPEEIPF
jgi:hypothetical protein